MSNQKPDDLQSKAAELFKKVLTVGVGAAFMTEESVRNLVSEFKLPKELITAILETAGKTRDEFLKSASSELVSQITNRIDTQALVKAVAQDLLRDNDVTIEMKLRLEPKSGPRKS
ncbi:MAG: hypothetical protein JNL01_09610 [Bdellovibrionales bacterium]|nr:hypothetical protein [Bdellovibrionales bacterium]